MAYDVLCRASHEQTFQAGETMRRRNNKVGSFGFSTRANLLAGVTNLHGRLNLRSIALRLGDEMAHLSARDPFGFLCNQGKVIQRILVAGEEILNRNRMRQDESRSRDGELQRPAGGRRRASC